MGKQHVTDADIAAEIRRVAPGDTFADVKAAAAVVCGRLNSRDDSETAAAFDEVLGRAELRPEPTAGDADTAAKLLQGFWGDYLGDRCCSLRDKIAAALAAARAPLEAKVKALEEALKREKKYYGEMKAKKEWYQDRMAKYVGAAREVRRQRGNHALILNKDDDGDFIAALNALAALVKAEEVEKMGKKLYLKLECNGEAGYLIDEIDGDVWLHEIRASSVQGIKYTITFVEMTVKEFHELPEFDGF